MENHAAESGSIDSKVVSLGQEHSFNQLVLSGPPCFDEALKRVRPTSVLDIGCEDGSALWSLYHQYDFIHHYEGWDVKKESKVLEKMKKFDNEYNPELKYESLFGRYCRVVEGLPLVRPIILDERAFRKAIVVNYETDVLTKVAVRTFDLIIVSNVTNGMNTDQVKVLIGKIKALSIEQSLVYVHYRLADNQASEKEEMFEANHRMWQKFAHSMELKEYEWWTDTMDLHITHTNLG